MPYGTISTDGRTHFSGLEVEATSVAGPSSGDHLFDGATTGAQILWDASDDRLEGTGVACMVLGETTTGYVGATPNPMIYGRYHGITTAVTGEGRGVRGNARLEVASTSGSTYGGYFQAGNGTYSSAGDGVNLGLAVGALAEVVTSSAGGSARTITEARGLYVSMDIDQADTVITTGHAIKVNIQSGSTGATHGTVHGLYLESEAVGGTGQQMDSAIYVKTTNQSGGVKGWNYGLNMSGADFNSEDIVLQNGETISNATDGTIAITGTLNLTRFIIDGDTWEDDGDGYFWGQRIRMDDTAAFASGAAKKTLAFAIHMDRPATDDMTGDSRDYGYYLDYTNRAQNDTGFNILGYRSQLSNRASGTLNIMRGIENTVRQRGDGSTISDGMEAALHSVNLDVGGSVPANFAYGSRVHWRFHGNAPSESAAFMAHNITDGVYTLATAAYGVRNDGTSGCKGFTYGLDLYDATATAIETADIRLASGITIRSGSGSPDGSVTASKGSLYVDTAGSADAQLFINEAGSTGWCAVDTST